MSMTWLSSDNTHEMTCKIAWITRITNTVLLTIGWTDTVLNTIGMVTTIPIDSVILYQLAQSTTASVAFNDYYGMEWLTKMIDIYIYSTISLDWVHHYSNLQITTIADIWDHLSILADFLFF